MVTSGNGPKKLTYPLRIDNRTESRKIEVMTIVKATKEKISHAPGDEEAWICLCENRPADNGFYPCDKEGNEMEPVKGWEDLYGLRH